jgi:uncharacterized protein (TIGR00251 family)
MLNTETIRPHSEGVLISIRVKPGSSRRSMRFLEDGNLLASVHSQAAEGKANREIIRFLSHILGLPPSRLEITSGAKSRYKTILVRGLHPDEARDRLVKFMG